MSKFQAGQKVRALRNTESRGGRWFVLGSEVEVKAPRAISPLRPGQFVGAADGVRYILDEKDFYVPVDAGTPGALDPTLVKAGATVTLERGKASVTDEVTAISSGGNVRPWFGFRLSQDGDDEGKRAVYADGDVREGWALTAHQPAPKPDTSEVGDAIRKLYDTDPDRDAYEGIALQVDDLWRRVQAHRVGVVIDPAGVDRDRVAQAVHGEGLPGTFDYLAADSVLAHLGLTKEEK